MAEEEVKVKLFGVWASPFSVRIQTALKLKGIQYEYIEEDLSNKSDLLLKYNPVHKKIPVFLHNGKPICESVIILEYIDETWKGIPILPQDPYERAIARFWAKFFDDKIFIVWKAFWGQGEEQEKAKEEAPEFLKILDNELKDKKFFGGNSIGLVDFVANFIALWIPVSQELTGFELLTKEKYPKLCGWIDEYLECDIIKETLPPRDKLLAHLRVRLQSTK